jgi:hypothetical protein
MSKRKLPKNLKLPLPETENKIKEKKYRMIRLMPINKSEEKKYVINQFEQESLIYNDLPSNYKFKYSGSKRINATTKTVK